MKNILIVIFFLTVCLRESIHAQPSVITFSSEEGVYIRWKAERSRELIGFDIYRQQSGSTDWTKLTDQPLAPLRKVEAIRSLLGYQTELYLKFFRCDSPPRDIDDAAYRKVVEDQNSNSFLNLFAVTNSKIALALGEMYIDKSGKAIADARYKVVARKAQGEITVGETDATQKNDASTIPVVQGIRAIVADKSVTLEWKKNERAMMEGSGVTFNVYRAESLLGDYLQVNTSTILPVTVNAGESPTTSDLQSYTDRFLENGKTYFYHVRMVNTFGFEGDPSVTVEATPRDTIRPVPPTNLRAELNGATVLITWEPTEHSAVTAYTVMEASSERGPWRKKSRLLATRDATPLYVDPKIDEGETKYYIVHAQTSDGVESEASEVVSVFYPDKAPPASPAGITGKASEGKITLTWKANIEKDLDGYIIERSGDREFQTRFLLTPKPYRSTMFIDTIAANDQTKYGYVLYAVDKAENRSLPSEMIYVKAFDRIPPQTPMIVSTRKGDSLAFIEWTKNIEDDFARYEVYRSENDKAHFKKIGSTQDNHHEDRTVSSGEFYYAISSVDSSGNESEKSNSVPIILESSALPNPPKSGTAVLKEKNIYVSWVKSESESIAGYLLARRRVRDRVIVQFPEIQSDGRQFVDKTADPETEYVYILRARDRKWRISNPIELPYIPKKK